MKVTKEGSIVLDGEGARFNGSYDPPSVPLQEDIQLLAYRPELLCCH